MPSDTNEEQPAESTTQSTDSGSSQVQHSTPAQDAAKENWTTWMQSSLVLHMPKVLACGQQTWKHRLQSSARESKFRKKNKTSRSRTNSCKRKSRYDLKRKLSLIAEENPAVGKTMSGGWPTGSLAGNSWHGLCRSSGWWTQKMRETINMQDTGWFTRSTTATKVYCKPVWHIPPGCRQRETGG